jgi:aspartyl protease family protein
MRALFVWVLMIGFIGSIAGSFHTRGDRTEERIIDREKADQETMVADLKAQNAPQFSSNDGSIQLERQVDGHFYADVRINGAPVHMLIDTGASEIALSRNDARMAGLATSIGMNDVVGEGADGAVHGEYVKLDNVSLGGTSASGLEAIVLNGGSQSLLGQEFLAKFDSVEIHGDTMVLK